MLFSSLAKERTLRFMRGEGAQSGGTHSTDGSRALKADPLHPEERSDNASRYY